MAPRNLWEVLAGVAQTAGQQFGQIPVLQEQRKRQSLLDSLAQNQDTRAQNADTRGGERMQFDKQKYQDQMRQANVDAMNKVQGLVMNPPPKEQKPFTSIGALEAYALQHGDEEMLNRIAEYTQKNNQKDGNKSTAGYKIGSGVMSSLSKGEDRVQKAKNDFSRSHWNINNAPPYTGPEMNFADSANVIRPGLVEAQGQGPDILQQLLEYLAASGVQEPQRFGGQGQPSQQQIPPNDGSMTDEEYKRFVEGVKAGRIKL